MRRVLIVEDHRLVREGLRRILSAAMGEIILDEAPSGQEALELIAENVYDVVILDVQMPKLDGIQVLREIRRMKKGPAVLILSMFPEHQYAVESIRLGAAGYVTKDIDSEVLVRAVERILAGGSYITPAVAERLAEDIQRGSPQKMVAELSSRERQVLVGLAEGQSMSDLANDLGLSIKTVSTYRTRLLRKLGMKSNADLIRFAIQNGLTS